MLAADDNALRLRAEVESEIERYLADCRGRATSFVTEHFTLRAVARAYGRTAASDVVRHPLNLALALPSYVLRKAADVCQRLEWPRAHALLERVPLPLKTAYERRIDSHLLGELFQLPNAQAASPSPLTQAMLRHPVISAAVHAQPQTLGFLQSDEWVRVELQKSLRDWGTTRAQIIDAAGSGAVLAASYLVFRSSGHGVLEMGRKVATERARTQAASGFFLGERVGSLFYSLAPVHPTPWQVIMATAVIVTFVGALAVAVNLLSDPLQRQLGMQYKQILRVIDGLEERMLSTLRKRLRATGPLPTPMPFSTVERVVQAIDVASTAASYARQGTVKVLAQMLGLAAVLKNRYIARVGRRVAYWSVVGVVVLALGGAYVYRRATTFDPYEEPYDLIERGAYPTALARLDWLNKNPGYKEQAYYWFLRGRALCGMGQPDGCTEAYGRALGKDVSYREEDVLIDDLVRVAAEHDHARAKKLILQELGPLAVPALRKAVLGATNRFEIVLMLEQLGARDKVPYSDIAKAELEAAESCEEKRAVVEKMVGEGWREAAPLLKPLQDARKWKCLQAALKARRD